MIIQVYEVQTQSEAEKLISMGVDHIGCVVLGADNWKIPALKDMIQTVAELGARSSLIPLFSDRHVIQKALEYYQPDIIHFCEILPDRILQPGGFERILQNQQHIREAFPQMSVMRTLPIPSRSLPGGCPVLENARLFEPISDYFLTDTLMVPEDLPAGSHASNQISGQISDQISGQAPDPASDKTTGPQPVSGFVGITGVICDWSLARNLVAATGIPVILAGGITPENVAEGIRRVQPAGVDSCTGTNACDPQGRPIRFQKDMNKVKRLVAAARQAATT